MGLFGGNRRKALGSAIDIGAIQDQARLEGDGTLPTMPKRPGIFSKGGKGWDVLGGTADTLLQMRGGPPVYNDGSSERLRQLILQSQIAQQTHQANRQYDLENPLPQQPPAIAGEVAWFNGLSPEEQKRVVSYLDYKNPVSVSGPAGTFNIPRTMPDMGGGTPVGTVEDGRVFIGGDDTKEENWKPVGGAGPQTPRPFP